MHYGDSKSGIAVVNAKSCSIPCRFNHPMPVRNSDRQELSKQLLAVKQGFEFARDELFQVQNARY